MVTAQELSVVTPADWVPGPLQGFWTYDDYAALFRLSLKRREQQRCI